MIVLGFLAGLSIGFATLTRGITFPYLIILVVLLFFHAKENRMFKLPINFWLITITIAVIPVLFWSYRNYLVSGKFIVVCSNSAENLWLGNNEASVMIWLPSYSPYREKFTGMNPVQYYEAAQKEAFKIIINHPVTTIVRWATKFKMLFDTGIYDLGFQELFPEQTGNLGYNFWNGINQIICFIIYLGVLCFFITGFLFPESNTQLYDKDFVKILLLFIAFWIFLHFISWGGPRFRNPIEPFIWILGIIGFLRFFDAKNKIKLLIQK